MHNNNTRLDNGYVRAFNPTNPSSPYTDIFYNRNKNLGVNESSEAQYSQSLAQSLQQFPTEFVRISPIRNTMFAFPSTSLSGMTLGTAGAPPIGAEGEPNRIGRINVAGFQVNSLNTDY